MAGSPHCGHANAFNASRRAGIGYRCRYGRPPTAQCVSGPQSGLSVVATPGPGEPTNNENTTSSAGVPKNGTDRACDLDYKAVELELERYLKDNNTGAIDEGADLYRYWGVCFKVLSITCHWRSLTRQFMPGVEDGVPVYVSCRTRCATCSSIRGLLRVDVLVQQGDQYPLPQQTVTGGHGGATDPQVLLQARVTQLRVAASRA